MRQFFKLRFVQYDKLNDEVAVTIFDAYTHDVGRRIARVDSKTMKSIGTMDGDVIELAGRKKTVAKILQLYPSEENKNMIRIDGLTRSNLGKNIGDNITIKKIVSQKAEKISVISLESIPPIDERYLADALENVPLIKGDNVMVQYFGGHLTFQIIDTKPDSVVLVDQKTIFSIMHQNPDRMIKMENTFVYTKRDNPTLLKKTVENYEKELLKKQEEIKIATRNMLKENHTIEDINKFLNSGMNQELLSIYQKLLNVYRQYVVLLEEKNNV